MRKTPELVDEADSPPPDDESWTVEVEGTPNRFPWLINLGIAFGVLIILFVSTLALAPIVLPASMTVGYAERMISQAIGVDAVIKGSHSFRILPSLRLEAERVMSASDEGAVVFNLPFVELEADTFGVLSGSVDVQRAVLRAPSIRIETGRRETDGVSSRPEIDRAWGWWRDMAVQGLMIEDATVVVADSRSGRALRLERFNIGNAPTSAADDESGLSLKGAGVLNGQNINVSVTTSDPQLLVSGNRWPFDVEFNSALLNGSFKGSMAVRERTVGGGRIVIGGSDVSAVNDWIGPLLPSRGAGPVALQADINIAGDNLEIGELDLKFGQTSLNGNLSISGISTGAPIVQGEINASVLDFGQAPADQAIAIMETPLMIPGMPSGEIQFAWQRAMWRGLTFGAGDAKIERMPGTHRLVLELEDTIVYGGTLRGSMVLDASEGMRALSIEARAIGADIGPMLMVGATGLDPVLSGTSNIEINLFSVGSSARELLQALTGHAEVVAQEGSLRIADLIDGLAPEAGGKLDYKSLNATFRIEQGIADSDDLLLRTGQLSLVGKGRIDLANWTIDLDVGRLGTEGDTRKLKRFRVSGPADEMRVEPINGS